MQPAPEISLWAVAGIMLAMACMIPEGAMLAMALWNWMLHTAKEQTETDNQNSEG